MVSLGLRFRSSMIHRNILDIIYCTKDIVYSHKKGISTTQERNCSEKSVNHLVGWWSSMYSFKNDILHRKGLTLLPLLYIWQEWLKK